MCAYHALIQRNTLPTRRKMYLLYLLLYSHCPAGLSGRERERERERERFIRNFPQRGV